MRIRLRMALVCALGLLLNESIADNGPLLFDGPPLSRQSSDVNLSVYQQEDKSPFEIEPLPPIPVPVPISEPIAEPEIDDRQPLEPDMVPGLEAKPREAPMPVPVVEPEIERQPLEPDVVPGLDANPREAPMPEVPAEPPVSLEELAEPPIQSEGPALPEMPETIPEERPDPMPPVVSDESEESIDDVGSDTPLIELPESFSVEPIVPDEFFCDESSRSCDPCRRSRCFRMPRISCADLALPTLPQPYIFDEFGVELGGWLEAGFSATGTSPADRFNGPITFNDRHAEAQMNQLWFHVERKPNTWACSPDLGGRIDVMYGTDAQYIQADDGLESNWGQSERFYQVALPQFYLDATLAGWTVRMGRFFTILGYEGPAAPDNFFYSHAYTMQYGEPFTHTGMLVSRRFGQWLVNAGFHRGNDQFDDTDGLNALNLLGGIGYSAPGDLASVEYAFSSTENGPGVLSYTHSLVNTVHITDKLDYVLQGDYGQIWNETFRRKASWWGLNQYFTYTLNPCWAAAARVEWFRDRDGNQVSGIRAGNQTPRRLAGDFYEITLGVNWKPRTNLRVRPEVRWDIFDPAASTTNQAFDAGNLNRQFTFGCDVIYKF